MPTEDEILKGMDDFSARARLDTTSFINELSRIGVDERRDFIVAGIVEKRRSKHWRLKLSFPRSLNAQLIRPDRELDCGFIDGNHFASPPGRRFCS